MGGQDEEDGEMFDDQGNLLVSTSPRKHRLNESALLENKREKEAYETILEKLRHELSDEADARRQLIADLSKARKEAALVGSIQGELDAERISRRRLEEDIANCEVEIAKSRRNELNAVATSTEVERNLSRVKDDETIISNELKEALSTITKERKRADRLAKELAEAEKRTADLQASKARAEAVAESSAQESGVKTRALNAMREGEEETLKKLVDLQEAHNVLRKHTDSLDSSLRNETLDKKALDNEVQRWKEVASMAETELRKEDQYVSGIEEQISRLSEDLRLSEEHKKEQKRIIESLQNEIGNVRSSAQDTGSLRAGSEIAMLRKELETTIHDWGEAERKRRDREDRLVELKAGLTNEQEKTSLLSTQLKLLEDQLYVAKEELAVYRQLDQYNESVHSGFAMAGASRQASSSSGSLHQAKTRASGGRSGAWRHTSGGGAASSPLAAGKGGDAHVSTHFSSPMSLVGDLNVSKIDLETETRSPEQHVSARNASSYRDYDDEEDDDEEFSKTELKKAKAYLLQRQQQKKGFN